jgi:hypothetical protein
MYEENLETASRFSVHHKARTYLPHTGKNLITKRASVSTEGCLAAVYFIPFAKNPFRNESGSPSEHILANGIGRSFIVAGVTRCKLNVPNITGSLRHRLSSISFLPPLQGSIGGENPFPG